MRDFFTAAFPWIIVGLCVAILAVRIGGKWLRRKDGKQDAKPHGDYGTEGMCLGVATVTGEHAKGSAAFCVIVNQ